MVSIDDLVVDEADGTANFVITLDRSSAGVVSIDYATQNGTALAGSDYVAASGTLNFAPGETAKTVKVLLDDDTIHEGPETFSLKLSNLVGATTLDPVGTATIDDNDRGAPAGHNDILFQNVSGQAAIWDVSGTTLITSALLAPIRDRTGKRSERATSTTIRIPTSCCRMRTARSRSGKRTGPASPAAPSAPIPGPSWKVVGTGDFNDDGHSDILLQNTNGAVAIWEMDGTSLSSSAVLANPGANWKAIGTGDFNDDGHSDILLQNTNGAVAVWEMDGTKVTTSAVEANPGPSWKAIGTGDFNGDGHSDILLQNADGRVAIWEMTGTTMSPISGIVSANPGASWHAIGTNHGGSDILFQNTSGQTAIWDMSGTTVTGAGALSANAGPNWRAVGLA